MDRASQESSRCINGTSLVHTRRQTYHSRSQPKNCFSYPSVQRLLREQGISHDTANIPATGPNGSLLKGDVLAYLGRVKQGYLSAQSQRLENLSHLDVRHTKYVHVKPVLDTDNLEANDTDSFSKDKKPQRSIVEVTIPISLNAVYNCQNLIRQSLEVNVPLSSFITRASVIANEESSKQASLSSKKDTIFDAIIGQEQTGRQFRFVPSMKSSTSMHAMKTENHEVDSLDFLTARLPTPKALGRRTRDRLEKVTSKADIFSVKVATGKRYPASIFLNKFKSLLELEPGQLILRC